jgi:hypothetical protein
MSLKINSQAPSFTAKNTQGKIDFRQWVPEAGAEGDLYGENGERMPYYPARPRQQGPYELVWDQNAWRFSSAATGARDACTGTRETPDEPASLER